MMRKRLLGTLMMLAMISVVIAGCKPSSENDDGKYTIAVIPKTTANAFWNKVKAGAEQAAEEQEVNIIWKGPPKETNINRQRQIVESQITRGVDAIVLAASDAKALDAAVKDADKQGIPVVTIDSGVVSDTPISHVATDNVEGGKKAAKKLAQLIDKKGKVGLIPFVQGSATSEAREKGFKNGLKEFPDVELVATEYSNSQTEVAMNKTQNMLTAHSDLKGIFAANLPGAVGAGRVLDRQGKAGEIKLVGFDAGDQEIEMLKNGIIQALIVQNPYEMGYKGVEIAVKHLNEESVSGRVDTGVTVVTQENLNDAKVQKVLNPVEARKKKK